MSKIKVYKNKYGMLLPAVNIQEPTDQIVVVPTAKCGYALPTATSADVVGSSGSKVTGIYRLTNMAPAITTIMFIGVGAAAVVTAKATHGVVLGQNQSRIVEVDDSYLTVIASATGGFLLIEDLTDLFAADEISEETVQVD